MIKINNVKNIFITTGAETFGLAVGAISGFLIVNSLSKGTYAEYTFLISCLTLIIGLSDMGLSHCYLPIVGERNKDTLWVLGACRHVYSKRWQLMAFASLVICPYWYFTASKNNWLNYHNTLAFATAITAGLLSMREQLGKVLLIIFNNIRTINNAGIYSNIARLTIVTSVLFWISEDYLITCLIATTIITSTLLFSLYRRVPALSEFYIAKLNTADKINVNEKILKIMKPMIFPSLFYQFQSVITIFLVSLLGSASTIAEIGALSRLAIILTVVDRVAALLVFSRIASSPAGLPLKKLIIKYHSFYFSIMLLLFSTAIFLPKAWILLLGAQYANQESLVWMAFLPAILMNGSGFAFTTLSARGITNRQWTAIPMVIIAQIIFLYFITMNSTFNALLFSITTSTVYFLNQYFLLLINFKNFTRIKIENK